MDRGDTIFIGRKEFVIVEVDHVRERATLVEVNTHVDDHVRITLSLKYLEDRRDKGI